MNPTTRLGLRVGLGWILFVSLVMAGLHPEYSGVCSAILVASSLLGISLVYLKTFKRLGLIWVDCGRSRLPVFLRVLLVSAVFQFCCLLTFLVWHAGYMVFVMSDGRVDVLVYANVEANIVAACLGLAMALRMAVVGDQIVTGLWIGWQNSRLTWFGLWPIVLTALLLVSLWGVGKISRVFVIGY